MPGISKARRKLNATLKRAREILYPQCSDPAAPSEITDLTNAESCDRLDPPNQDVAIEDEIDEDDMDMLHVEGIEGIVTRFVALEEEGRAPAWTPDTDEDEDLVHSQGPDIEGFTQRLQRLYDEEVKREQERRKHNNRSSGYTKNSAKTLLWHKQKRDAYVAGGGRLISSFIPKKKRKTESAMGPEHEVIEIDDESESESSNMTPSAPEITPTPPTLLPQQTLFPHEDNGPTPQDAHDRLDQLRAAAKATTERLEELDAAERALNQLTWQDRPALRKAVAGLAQKVKEKKLDVFFRARIAAMVATINYYLDEDLGYTWRQASELAARGEDQEHWKRRARNLRSWIHRFLSCGELPTPHYSGSHGSMLEDEGFVEGLQTYLLEVAGKGFITAQNVIDYVQTEEVQKKFKGRTGYGGGELKISLATGDRWLKKLDWRYGHKRKGMYVDGHEREDVVEYRKKFCERWKEYEKRMVKYDNDGNILSTPVGFAVPQGPHFRLILITHDESTFYQRNQRKKFWQHTKSAPAPERKGEGDSLMASDFLTPEWGQLIDTNGEEAWILFEAGSKRDGYFANEHILEQTSRAIDIFESRTNGTCTGLFMFNNALSHQKRADDALSARKMVKGPHPTWLHRSNGPKMRPGRFSDGRPQDFYFPNDHPTYPGWFKGMEIILRERGLYPASGLNAACPKVCFDTDNKACCCWKVLFCQPDFIAQKPALAELVESRGHICDFYPKYHCELNFIEQYWGASKYEYRGTPPTSCMKEMRTNVVRSLDSVPLLKIRRFANRSARFIHAYSEGLSGSQAAWANRQYHGHRTLPPEMLAKARAQP